MAKSIFSELHKGIPREGGRRNAYTQKAFKMIPPIDRPNILDIGCGPGEPTIMLAKLSNGNVTGLDINQTHLDELERKAEKHNLSNRVKTVNRSMLEMDFPNESFDIIWAEGSMWLIGFEKGLKEWRRFIKPNGFLAAHEMCWLRPNPPLEIWEYWERNYPGTIRTIEENLDVIPGCGYVVAGYFTLPEDVWWNEYYCPLQDRIRIFRERYKESPNILAELDKEQEEIDLYRRYRKWFGSAFYITQKN